MTALLLLKIIFYFPATFAHEAAHYIAATIFGRPEKISLIPKTEDGNLIYGNVTSSVRYKIFSSFISAAPSAYLLLLYFLLTRTGVLNLTITGSTLNISITPPPISGLLEHVVLFWVVTQLLWAGIMSVQDLKVFVRGIVSPSGAVFILLAATGYNIYGMF